MPLPTSLSLSPLHTYKILLALSAWNDDLDCHSIHTCAACKAAVEDIRDAQQAFFDEYFRWRSSDRIVASVDLIQAHILLLATLDNWDIEFDDPALGVADL